jgi:nucleotide-binding universal stress UspA family protein
LIALSSRGQTGLTRLLLGSVAEKVVRLAHCPVLVLKKGTKS